MTTHVEIYFDPFWTWVRLPPSPILPVIASVRAILYGVNTHIVRDLTKSREFEKREYREFWVKKSQILFWRIKRVLL